MHQQNMAILQSLITVAWADGKVADEEKEVIEALLQAFDASKAEAEFIRDYAKEKKTLADIPVDELLADDRRVLLQHAVLVTFIDGVQDDDEKKFLTDLAAKLEVPEAERDQLLNAATDRAKRFLSLL
jgi:tellurite resistance protein